MRLIDADKLIGDIQKKLAIKTIEYLTEQEMSIVKMIINAPTENKWIPVSERLPEEKAMVVACYADGSVGIIYEARPNLWRESYYLPIAWMPLPKPYTESEVK